MGVVLLRLTAEAMWHDAPLWCMGPCWAARGTLCGTMYHCGAWVHAGLPGAQFDAGRRPVEAHC
eukprot:1161885-Pelagomonas_calceolata.AAC.6